VWLAPLAAIIAGGLFALQRTRAPALPVAEATAAAVRELRERVAREEREEQES
jgi:hypothetical protein